MFDIKTLLILIPALPLAATLLTAALGPRVLRERSHLLVVTAVALSFVAAMVLVFQVQEQIERPAGPHAVGYEQVITPLAVGPVWSNGIDITLRADPLTAAMLAIVTCISTLVAIYSIGYMHDDPGYWRFFTYISLFVFSMTMLVSASNFASLYVFWEAVGLCSYLLIGFWFEKPAAAAAGKKAFLVNRLGDCGFAPGRVPDLDDLRHARLPRHRADGKLVMGVLGQARLASPGLFAGGGLATAIACCCCSGPAARAPSFRCTSGCPMPWKAPRRSAP